VVALEHKYAPHDQRLVSVEGRLTQADIADARKEEQFKSLLEKFRILDKKLDKTNGYLMAIVIAIAVGLIGAFVKVMQTGVPG
jgi:hypothetical protein